MVDLQEDRLELKSNRQVRKRGVEWQLAHTLVSRKHKSCVSLYNNIGSYLVAFHVNKDNFCIKKKNSQYEAGLSL